MSRSTQPNTFSLRPVLEKNKLNGSNFLDWYRNLRSVLKQERKDYVLQKILPEKLVSRASNAVREAWFKHYDDMVDVRSLMLATMNSDLQLQFEKVESPIEMINGLKAKYQGLVRIERSQTLKTLFKCELRGGAPVGPHVMKMICLIDNLRRLDHTISDELATDTILQSLPPCYDRFVMDYNKHDMTKTLTELHDMLEAVEHDIQKATPMALLMMGHKGFDKPILGKRKDRAVQAEYQNKPVPSLKSSQVPSDVSKCKYCSELGHRRRECKKFAEDLIEIEKMYGTTSQGNCVNVNTSSSTYGIGYQL